MYTRNFALSRYNHPSLPAGCELDPGALKAPAHMRVLFQALGSASGRAPIPATSVDDGVQLVDSDTEKGRVQCSRLVAALSSASTYAEAVAHAKGTAWTRKVRQDGVFLRKSSLDSRLQLQCSCVRYHLLQLLVLPFIMAHK
jgi:hypothetical protein